ncbi:hypothetical protein KAFR_0C01800 [Kazachstania africana CBS 2517]|uniref:Large ribosomal subunit protein mL38 n=1 Tax=Kazachstania africana (strain ATCC 22294 / BCRC 22015 / CBS 2517 / CECT 1963 / NBRC 1671 / NRRL Y-8276) TaxID=1071382 RepID=H2AS23_KAZAF|nr:hypothetical protein KAFR_0C01800 [Kazachstania africana CBS 2517]CCF57173.1 hypothetical protein KAFR_0C01800 [Kazachstania africana CBS 2517]
MANQIFKRLLTNSSIARNSGSPTTHVWSDFTSRSRSLEISSKKIKESLLKGTPATGPPTIHRKFNRYKYKSPEYIDETFKISLDFLEQRASESYHYAKLQKNPKLREELLVKAEINNPEVQYNFQFSDKLDNNPNLIDYEQPVYRYLGKKNWESYGQMLLMQRLETLNVIPDTLPTLLPKVDVNVKFPYSTGINKWIEQGEILSSNVTSMEPVIKIQEFELINPEQLYSILIVNPDEPDLSNDSFKTTLCYGLANLKVSYNDNIIDTRKISESNLLAEYSPPVTEKNAGIQRYSVWVFRQNIDNDGKCIHIDIPNTKLDRNNFNIREFVKHNQLEAVGAHVWRSEWDSNVKNVRESYGLPAGRVFSRVRI